MTSYVCPSKTVSCSSGSGELLEERPALTIVAGARFVKGHSIKNGRCCMRMWYADVNLWHQMEFQNDHSLKSSRRLAGGDWNVKCARLGVKLRSYLILALFSTVTDRFPSAGQGPSVVPQERQLQLSSHSTPNASFVKKSAISSHTTQNRKYRFAVWQNLIIIENSVIPLSPFVPQRPPTGRN